MRLVPGRRTVLALLVVIAVLGLAPSGAAGAATASSDDGASAPSGSDRPGPRIVDGTLAAPGAWPSQVALVQAGTQPVDGQFCGGTVVARTWVLTAGHCVTTSTGGLTSRSSMYVLAGTHDLASGGARIGVVEIRRHPRYDDSRLRNDVALLRLDHPVPTSVPVQALAGAGTDPTGGTTVTAIGWGDLGNGTYPSRLRQADLSMRNPSGCGVANGTFFDSATMVCATGAAARGVCFGDSGGPLLVFRNETWVQVGVASWTYDCGTRDSVFARVSAYSSWVAQQVRYGPHPDAASFVRRQYLDVLGRQPTDTEMFYGVASLGEGRAPADLTAALLGTSAFDARTGGVVRLYQAIFLRRPDSAGLMYWKGQVDRPVGLKRIADQMVRAPEFGILYGDLGDSAFVDLVYDNVLDRAPSAQDRAWWVAELTSGRRTRGQVMVGFSESPEYKTLTRADVAVIGPFAALVRRVPTSVELAQWRGRSTLDLATFLLASYGYANRF